MANFNPYANYGYFALKKETTAGTPVQPDTYLKVKSESLQPAFNLQDINEVAGDRERKTTSIQGSIEMSGDVEFFVEPKTIGYFLTGIMGAPTSQTAVASTSYRHRFEVQNDDKTYTVDVQPADAPWVHRFYGVHIQSLSLSKDENAITCTAGLKPTKAFIAAKLTADASSGTTLDVDQTEGLTTDDTIIVVDKDDGYTTIATYTISAISAANKTITTNETISDTLDTGDFVMIKRAAVTTASYTQCEPFQFANGTSIYTGDDIDNTSSDNKEDFTLEIQNELEDRYTSGNTEASRYPAEVLIKGFTASGSVMKFYDSESNLSKLRSNEKMAIRFLMEGQTAISANSAVKASSTWGTTNGFKIEASTAGKAGNDINVTTVINSTDTLAASKSGNNILISLANSTSSNNTGTLIAAAVDALSGVDGTAEGTGAEEFTTAESNVNLGARGTGTDVVGLDANQKPYLQFDFADARLGSYFVNNAEDNTVMEEIPLMFYKDVDCDDQQRKNWSVRIYLFNDVASY